MARDIPEDLHGWCGKILDIDLTRRRVSELNTLAYANRFLGGRGIATKIYHEQVGPHVGAFDPENRLIFMTGPMCATGAQSASRCVVVGKSPMRMPEGFCYGNFGGFFGPYLKRAGLDGVIISGKSETPVYLFITEDGVDFLDASALRGKGVYAVRGYLKQTHGKQTRFVTTGPAGDNRCRCANVMTDNEGSATGGFGAVMGAKNLKAVAVTGAKSPTVADPEALKKLSRQVLHLNRRDPLFIPFPPDQVKRTGKASCFQCGIDCIYRNTFHTASGKDVLRKCQAMFVYFPWVAGKKDESFETAIDATGICNDLSLCTMEMYNIVHWLKAGFESGFLTRERTGLDISQLGTRDFFEQLAGMIARREGFGDILAEGLLRAGDILGDDARSLFTNEVAGVGDGATYSAREYLMNGLLYAMEPRQPIGALHEVSRMVGFWAMRQDDPRATPVTNDVFRGAAAKFWKHEKAWDLTTHEGKAEAAVHILDRTYVKDSLMLCDSAWPLMFSWNTPDGTGDPGMESRLFSAVTGIDMDEAGLNRFGERIFNLQRAVLLREGRRPKLDDDLADFNFTDPVKTVFMNPKVIIPGPGNEVLDRRGKTVSRDEFETMRREFYDLRGWDPDTGLQKSETLDALALGDLMAELRSHGRLED